MHKREETDRIILSLPDRPLTSAESRCLKLLNSQFNRFTTVTISNSDVPEHGNLIAFLDRLESALNQAGETLVATAFRQARDRCTEIEDFGGYGFAKDAVLSSSQEADIVFLCSAFLEAVKCEERASNKPKPLYLRPPGRPGMTISEKILAMHDVSRRGYVTTGDIIQVDVDWVLASELSWQSLETTYEAVGRPGIFRNDRFWLAGDHRVEPELYEQPKIRKLMESSERAHHDFKMTDFQGFNYTIMHTEFARERAQPGMLCIGADSHTCSAGSVSCLSIGMGATDVCMPLVTGQTWLTVPKIVNIRFVNQPPRGIGGKDTILSILGQFKRNTIAADRIVEFTGPGLKHLSCDARFAIANMCTEFGAITGIFESDDRTVEFVEKRRLGRHKRDAIYYRADDDANYESTYEIDLSKVEPFIAIYPSPDNVKPVSEVISTHLDGTFIGACTTAEEDLVIAALVLKAGLDQGLKPIASGRRVVVPGSKPIRHKLQKLGLLDIYTQAGFKVGVPGCSMCVGQGVDQAAPGEVWLSSQNRNFKNRMGPGSIANISSAATVAASSFSMQVSDPKPLLERIDMIELAKFLKYQPFKQDTILPQRHLTYSEPFGRMDGEDQQTGKQSEPEDTLEATEPDHNQNGDERSETVVGKPLLLGDFIDTDAIIPSAFLAGNSTNEDFGKHCMEYFMPEFRAKVQQGYNIVVGGDSFGVGSSRDVAVNALLGAGVKCVIAKSFAFIYARNQPNIGLLGIVISDDRFHMLVQQNPECDISVDVSAGVVRCEGEEFTFKLSQMEKSLIEAGGLTEAFMKFGKEVFTRLCQGRTRPGKSQIADIELINI